MRNGGLVTDRNGRQNHPPATPEAASGDAFAAALRGFGPIGLVAVALILAGNFVFAPLSALLVLAWARRARIPWPALGFARPTSWTKDLVVGFAIGVGLRIAIKAVAMPLFGFPATSDRYHELVGNAAALPAMVVAILVVAGFGEEALFRGFLFERLGRLLGTGPAARVAIVVITSVWFGLAHFVEQGVAGVVQSTLVGLVLGTVFAVTGRLWIPMVAHAAFDLLALAIIYLGLESAFGNLVFA